MISCILIASSDNVGGGVGDAQVQDLASADEVVEALHDLLARGRVLPPVQVQNVDVIGLELLERLLDGDLHALRVVARAVNNVQSMFHRRRGMSVLIGLVLLVAAVHGGILEVQCIGPACSMILR